MSFSFFGEVMLRLTPSLSAGKICTTQSLNVDYAGAESNVASSLTQLGHSANFITKFPSNPIGDGAIRALESHGIATHHVGRGGERMGTYFIELGSSIRPSQVVYDRANSAIAAISTNEFDWETILKGQKYLHLSGITLAISENAANETIKAATVARAMGVKVSFDLNFRRTLWQDKQLARERFEAVLAMSDIAHGNTGVMADVFDLTYNEGNTLNNTKAAAIDAQKRFGLETVAFTTREHASASQNTVGGVLFHNNECVSAISYELDVLDRFGTGDAYAAGVLHALAKQWDAQKAVDFATAAFALKHTIHGDQHTSNEAEIFSIAQGNTSGHVIR